MNWFQFFIMLSLVWWLVFFCLLPIGIKNAHESGEKLVDGQEIGAPTKGNVRKKMLYTTVISIIITLSVKLVMNYHDFVIPA